MKDKTEGLKLNQKFISQAIDWSKSATGTGEYKRGEPSFHFMAAKICQQLGEAKATSDHFVHAHEPKEFAAFLFAWSKSGYSNERDLFLTKSLLQLLAQENLKDANELFSEFVSLCGDDNDTPLLNFCRFLLKTLERDAFPLFKTLREKYAPVLSSDPTFSRYLDTIAEKFFNVKAQKTGLAALLQNSLGMFGAPQA